MKKPVLFIAGVLLFALISIYFIIPQKIKTTSVINIDATDVNVSKFMVNKKPWAKWWPGRHNTADSTLFVYKGVQYHLQKSTNESIQVLVNTGDMEINSGLSYLTPEEGMTTVTWTTEKQSSINPITRIAEFVKIKSATKDLDEILAQFKKFMQTDVNVYGMHIGLSKVQEPIVLATTINTKNYPETAVIYSMIDNLKQQISLQKAQQVGYPMLNINATDTHAYQVMVAIPIDKPIKPAANSVINTLVKGANILGAEVKGGRYTITNAFVQLKNYQKDHRLISPAMPYEQLITNRLTEKDTAKWVTKVYYPVF